VVDVEGTIGVQVAQWVIRDSSQVDDGVKALQVRRFHVTYVLADSTNGVGVWTESAVLKQAVIEAGDLVARAD
jgi:hypothetical protein